MSNEIENDKAINFLHSVLQLVGLCCKVCLRKPLPQFPHNLYARRIWRNDDDASSSSASTCVGVQSSILLCLFFLQETLTQNLRKTFTLPSNKSRKQAGLNEATNKHNYSSEFTRLTNEKIAEKRFQFRQSLSNFVRPHWLNEAVNDSIHSGLRIDLIASLVLSTLSANQETSSVTKVTSGFEKNEPKK